MVVIFVRTVNKYFHRNSEESYGGNFSWNPYFCHREGSSPHHRAQVPVLVMDNKPQHGFHLTVSGNFKVRKGGTVVFGDMSVAKRDHDHDSDEHSDLDGYNDIFNSSPTKKHSPVPQGALNSNVELATVISSDVELATVVLRPQERTYKFSTDCDGLMELVRTTFYNQAGLQWRIDGDSRSDSAVVITLITQQSIQDITTALAPLTFGALMCQTLALEAEYTGIPVVGCTGTDDCECEDCKDCEDSKGCQ